MALKAEKAAKALFMSLVFVMIYSVLQIFAVYLFGAVSAALSGTKMTFEDFTLNHLIGSSLTSTLAAMAGAGAVYIMIDVLREKKPSLEIVPIDTSTVVNSVIIAICLRVLVGIYTVYSSNIPALKESLENAPDYSAALDSPLKLIIGLFSMVIAAPIFEEVLFRRLVLGELTKGFRKPLAIVISALIFGVAHGLLFQSVFTFFVGLALGYVFLKTRSLLSSVVIHIIFNSSAALQFVFEYTYTWINIVLCALSLAGIIICMMRLKNQKNE